MFARFLALGLISAYLLLNVESAVSQDVQEPLKFDYMRLAHPEVSSQLELTDEQVVEINKLINARAEAFARAADVDRPQVIAKVTVSWRQF